MGTSKNKQNERTPEQGYAEALRRIEAARTEGAKEVDLSSLHLTAVPKELGELKGLKTLQLYNNKLTALPNVLEELKALEFLNLLNNRLTAVPKELGELTALTRLSLAVNQIAAVPKELRALRALKTLYLNRNQLIGLPSELGELKSLTELDVSNNQLTALPKELGELKALTKLFLHDNPGLGLPPEVLGPTWVAAAGYAGSKDAAKPAEVLAYYFGLQKAIAATKPADLPRPLNEAKILVVGEPGVGKTMLVEWLTKGKPKKNPEWTKGIKILPWKVACSDGKRSTGADDIKVSIWDFGGQEIMQATHQFFLTERSLYLLVLDSRENEEQSKIRYWLDKIRAFGGDSPVIVVLNKRDEGQQEPDENRLKLDYAANLREAKFIRTACKSAKGIMAGYGIHELREAITARVRQLDNVTQPVLPNYLKAKEAFEKESKAQKRMDRKNFDAICRKNGVKNEIDRDTLLSYLKSLGSLFHYKRGEEAHKTLVLDPQWLTGGVYKLLTDHAVRERGGVLTPKDVSRIFARSMNYTGDARAFILEMMEGDPFDLSFKIPDTDGERLIPELLPPNEPDHGIDRAESLNVQYHYNFLPAGLIPRFIVRMHNTLKTGPAGAWKNGVVVTVDGRRVLVRGVREAKRVYVAAQGREPATRRALAIVRQNLDMVHRAMKHLEVTEHVALNDDPGITIPYADLLQYEKDEGSAYQFRPPGAKRKYSIRELLDGIEEPEWRRKVRTFKNDLGWIMTEILDERSLAMPEGQVFISYANEPDASHAKLVRELADKLREQGVNAYIDQYLGEMGPDVDWPLWMERQIQESRVVLMVCSPAYHRRVEGKEKHGKGLGATYEGKLVRQEMYNNGVVNMKYRPVLMHNDHAECIPLDLQGATHFKLYESGGYDRLYRALTGQPSIIAPPLGKPVIMPPAVT